MGMRVGKGGTEGLHGGHLGGQQVGYPTEYLATLNGLRWGKKQPIGGKW